MSGGPGTDDALSISWHDSAWIPVLNPANVMDYFAERSNPFYDRTCNNEIVKMQRLNPDQINNMTGVEYILLHVQEPILYVIRKQDRHSATQVTPIADYYIIAGVVYQAPDLGSVINSRMLNTMHSIQSAFTESHSFSKYHPSKGYWWEFKEKEDSEKKSDKDKKKKKEEPSSAFQRQRVDDLLVELTKKFPLKIPAPPPQAHQQQPHVPGAATVAHPPPPSQSNAVSGPAGPTASGVQHTGTGTQDQSRIVIAPDQIKQEIKQEKIDIKIEKPDEVRQQISSMKPPPDKKPKLMR